MSRVVQCLHAPPVASFPRVAFLLGLLSFVVVVAVVVVVVVVVVFLVVVIVVVVFLVVVCIPECLPLIFIHTSHLLFQLFCFAVFLAFRQATHFISCTQEEACQGFSHSLVYIYILQRIHVTESDNYNVRDSFNYL
ncbi:unnamed protein product [Polarella glacialis]|uniref:Uncharacterized protein n=1 Tax=Polarella glacialis TaxID=89957 RepID=A0A813ESP1_POLGL|nr:unnamed protein product [Polarella glacialis]